MDGFYLVAHSGAPSWIKRHTAWQGRGEEEQDGSEGNERGEMKQEGREKWEFLQEDNCQILPKIPN